MAKPKVKLNSAGVRDLLHDPGVEDELWRRMEPVLAEAQATAPVDTGDHYRSLHLEPAVTDRVTVRLVADSDHSLYTEATTGHMARALDAATDT